jgi:transforming growth factor-beta-induced protein
VAIDNLFAFFLNRFPFFLFNLLNITLYKMKKLITLLTGTGLISTLFLSSPVAQAQTNVYDNVILTSPNHTSLAAALQQAGLVSALQNPAATLTVFAPDNAAFNNLAADLNTNVAGLLALPNLSDILLYHVLGVTVPASAVTNGAVVSPLSPTNTVKMTKTSLGSVYANHAMVNAADLTASNGVVHSVNAVLLPGQTVLDVAINNGFTTLQAALATAELFPAVTDPFATLTVFAPTDQAFNDLLTALNISANDLLANPALTDYLLYHVLGTTVASSAINNGDIVNPINTSNSLKLTVTSIGSVYVNQAKVTLADVNATNGTVHVLDAVLLPVNTVVDVAIDNSFTTLATALIQEELIPALSDPLAQFTVFAPTNQAFDDLAAALSTDINGLLALPNLQDVLLYHVTSGEVLSTGLTNGPVPMLNGADVLVNLTAGVQINDANVTTADVQADNGVVHVIDAVLLPTASLTDNNFESVLVYPNPASNVLSLKGISGTYKVFNMIGAEVMSGVTTGTIDVQTLTSGQFLLECQNENGVYRTSFSKN